MLEDSASSADLSASVSRPLKPVSKRAARSKKARDRQVQI